MSKFTPSLHPRAKNGKFRKSGKSGKSFAKYKTNKLRTSGSAARLHIATHTVAGAGVGALAGGPGGALAGAAIGGAIGIAGVSSVRRKKGKKK